MVIARDRYKISWCGSRVAYEMRNGRGTARMIDRAVGVAGLALTIIFGVLLIVFPTLNRNIGYAGLALGVLLLGGAIGITFLPDGNAQSPPVVNQGPGSAYSSGQQGGITAGTVMSEDRNAPPKTGWAKMVTELHVIDLNASLAFWKDILGFEIAYSRDEEKFVYLEHPEGQQIMLCQRHGRFETGPMQYPLGQGAMFQSSPTPSFPYPFI